MTLKEVLERTTDRSILTNDELWEVKFALQDRLKQIEKDLILSTENELDFHTKCLKENYKTTTIAIKKIELLL